MRWYRLSALETATSFLGGALLAATFGGFFASLVVSGVLTVALVALLQYRDWTRRSIRLVDAEAMHGKYPETFDLPAGRSGLVPGNLVKLSFGNLERMWVRVVKVNLKPKVSYEGVLMNEPILTCLRSGQRICFEPRHVFEIEGES